jgi:rhodanese-related sulfurtransferase
VISIRTQIVAEGTIVGDLFEEALMPTPIDRDEVQRLISEEEAQLVEVLPKAEYEDEHLPGAINIPLKELDRERAQQLDRERPVVVYCHDYQ